MVKRYCSLLDKTEVLIVVRPFAEDELFVTVEVFLCVDEMWERANAPKLVHGFEVEFTVARLVSLAARRVF